MQRAVIQSSKRVRSLSPWWFALALAGLGLACGDDDDGGTQQEQTPAPNTAQTDEQTPEEAATPEPGAVPADLEQGLLIAYSPFERDDNGGYTRPLPARLELLTRSGGQWRADVITDEDSNVFHKAMAFTPDGGAPGILTVGGTGAFVKLWRQGETGWTAQTLWTEEFGGERNRMRDVEVGDVTGDGKDDLVVATHDMGVVAVVRQEGEEWKVDRLDRRPNTFVHEIELGDLDGDGKMEVYATPSEPNHMGSGGQAGEVVRYVPSAGGESTRTVVAKLGNRHAKEILVADVDGDGRDELYVSVEGITDGGEVKESVEIRRYDAGTHPEEGVVIATIEGDSLTRFLTAGDVDGDGKRELAVASFGKGLWLLRPGTDPRSEWGKESIDRDSGGFEHASVFADLDGNDRDELYVASDNDGELRRYVWVNGRARRETIHSRSEARSMMTWNIMPAPQSLLRSR